MLERRERDGYNCSNPRLYNQGKGKREQSKAPKFEELEKGSRRKRTGVHGAQYLGNMGNWCISSVNGSRAQKAHDWLVSIYGTLHQPTDDVHQTLDAKFLHVRGGLSQNPRTGIRILPILYLVSIAVIADERISIFAYSAIPLSKSKTFSHHKALEHRGFAFSIYLVGIHLTFTFL